MGSKFTLLQELLDSSKGITFKTSKGSIYTVTSRGTTIRDKAARAEHANDSGKKPESEVTFYVTNDDADKIGSLYQTMTVERSIVIIGMQATIKWLSGKYAGKLNPYAVVDIKREPEVGLVPIELWKDGTVVHFGNQITEIFNE
jgi:hypothetical protein